MEPFDRQPPRFVPTLTDVVPEGLPIRKPSAFPQMPSAVPVPPAAVQMPQAVPAAAPAGRWQTDAALQHAVTESLVARMQPVLQERLRIAVADMVRTHTDALLEQLSESLEDVVRSAVADAVAQERSRRP